MGKDNFANMGNLTLYPAIASKGIVVRKPVIEAPDVASLVVSLAASSSKHAGVYAYRYTCAARLLIWALNRADYQIKKYKLYFIN